MLRFSLSMASSSRVRAYAESIDVGLQEKYLFAIQRFQIVVKYLRRDASSSGMRL